MGRPFLSCKGLCSVSFLVNIFLWIYAAQKRVIAFGAHEKSFSNNGRTKAAWPLARDSDNGEKRVCSLGKGSLE